MLEEDTNKRQNNTTIMDGLERVCNNNWKIGCSVIPVTLARTPKKAPRMWKMITPTKLEGRHMAHNSRRQDSTVGTAFFAGAIPTTETLFPPVVE
mmetsp:Transcript_20922/g.31708  ORF Transcript_20922/g.31708 Transcript_20922/m.31708 type:complete len:95 (-) Transcript_20922:410-694(-)